LLKLNISSIKGYLLREDFQQFWEYKYPAAAEKFLDNWITRTLQTDLEPMKKVANMLRNHKPLIMNWVQGKRTAFQRRRRGFKPQSETDYQKSV